MAIIGEMNAEAKAEMRKIMQALDGLAIATGTMSATESDMVADIAIHALDRAMRALDGTCDTLPPHLQLFAFTIAMSALERVAGMVLEKTLQEVTKAAGIIRGEDKTDE